MDGASSAEVERDDGVTGACLKDGEHSSSQGL